MRTGVKFYKKLRENGKITDKTLKCVLSVIKVVETWDKDPLVCLFKTDISSNFHLRQTGSELFLFVFPFITICFFKSTFLKMQKSATKCWRLEILVLHRQDLVKLYINVTVVFISWPFQVAVRSKSP